MGYESCWLINFKNGHKMILSEKAYERLTGKRSVSQIESEEHWFVMQQCIEENPDADVIE